MSLHQFVFDFQFKSHLKDLDLSNNKLLKNYIRCLNQFDYLERINPSNCNLESGFMEYLSVMHPAVSLKKINLSRNILSKSDIFALEKFLNLNHLTVCFQSEIYSNFLKEYGALRLKNLETLILVASFFTSEIYHCIMRMSSLKNFELQGFHLEKNVFTNYGISYPNFLQKITHIYSKYYPEDIDTFNDLKIRGIEVFIY
ncbi:hypothetical protein LUQ84_001915 [Hamiltosporidium tvaerminnensis]|nr:hypothetical protein LUQ84_001915 [Hamiltosporidium tvaerminnensis]